MSVRYIQTLSGVEKNVEQKKTAERVRVLVETNKIVESKIDKKTKDQERSGTNTPPPRYDQNIREERARRKTYNIRVGGSGDSTPLTITKYTYICNIYLLFLNSGIFE